jgi:hypothetical protein
METLLALAGNPGEVVSKRELVDAVWQSGFVADNTVVHCINELREALGDTPLAPRYLQTIPRKGYRLFGRATPVETASTTQRIDLARYQLEAKTWSAYVLDGTNLIGRDGEAPIIVPSARVSRHHASITVSDHCAVIEDLGSKNGTFVAGRRIDQPTGLDNGVPVRIADFEAVFCCRTTNGRAETVSMDSD